MYVYRDTGGQPDDLAAAAPGPDQHDASYWYDLPGSGAGGEATPHVSQETRGPFEPLVSSADPPGTAPHFSASLDDAEPAYPLHTPEAGEDDRPADTAQAHAQKLEQIKDLYLTAEAIGEVNVDKHFDQLLAQQRELISEYFKQSSVARPVSGSADQAGAEPPGPGQEPGDPGDGAPAGGPTGGRKRRRYRRSAPRMVTWDRHAPVIAVLGLGEAARSSRAT